MRTSETIGEIAAAFVAAQAQISTVKKDKKASAGKYGYTYASLATVMESIAEPLANNGLAIIQSLAQDPSQVIVTTRLLHVSGEWLEGDCTMPIQNQGPQAVGSAITYGRRYGLSALIGVVSDDDDDAAAAQQQSKRKKGFRTKQQSAPPLQDHPLITQIKSVDSTEQLAELAVKLKEADFTAAQRDIARDAWRDATKRVAKKVTPTPSEAHDYGPPPMTDDDLGGPPDFGFE